MVATAVISRCNSRCCRSNLLCSNSSSSTWVALFLTSVLSFASERRASRARAAARRAPLKLRRWPRGALSRKAASSFLLTPSRRQLVTSSSAGRISRRSASCRGTNRIRTTSRWRTKARTATTRRAALFCPTWVRIRWPTSSACAAPPIWRCTTATHWSTAPSSCRLSATEATCKCCPTTSCCIWTPSACAVWRGRAPICAAWRVAGLGTARRSCSAPCTPTTSSPLCPAALSELPARIAAAPSWIQAPRSTFTASTPDPSSALIAEPKTITLSSPLTRFSTSKPLYAPFKSAVL